MPERVAEEYLNDICSGIPGREIAEEVRAELLDHLESRIDEYMKRSYDRETAEKRAVEDMGERKQVCEQLSHLHRRIPYFDLKNALTKIIIGLFLQFFNVDIGSLSTITTAIGLCFLFAGILQLRKVNGFLGKAWIASIIMVSYVFLANVASVSPLFYFGSEDALFSYTIGAIRGLLLFICLYYLGKGLTAMLERSTASWEAVLLDPLPTREAKKINNIGGLYFGAYAVAMISVWIPGAQFLALIPFVILVSKIILRLIRVRSLLLRGQLSYGATDPGKKAWAGLWIAGCAFVAIPFMISAVQFAMPRTFWYEGSVIREKRTEITTEQADYDQVLSDLDPYMADILRLLPVEEIENINGTIEYDEYYSHYALEMDTQMDASYLICRKEDQTILQFVCFSISDGVDRGGWDSILIPESAFPPAEPGSVSRVYIYTEDENGRVFEQRPIALRYGTRTIRQENRQVRDIVCVDYAVADQGCRQWVIICSTLIDDDGHGNRYLLNIENPIPSMVKLNPLADYVYIRRTSWFPRSYQDSVERISDSENIVYLAQEIGYQKIYMDSWDTQMEFGVLE